MVPTLDKHCQTFHPLFQTAEPVRSSLRRRGYCTHTADLEKLEEKGQQDAELQGALGSYGCNTKLMSYICGCTSPLFKSIDTTMRMSGEESAAVKNPNTRHEHSITCADNLMKCRR